MKTLRITAAVDKVAGVERDADGEVIAFRLFRSGTFRTDHGSTTFDAEAARLVMAERELRGNRYAIDFDHLSLKPDATPEQRRAAGSFDIELRGGELWAVDLRLTEEARTFVRAGAYLSVSPAWDQDVKTKRVTSLVNCALTSNPATHGAVRFAAARMPTARRSPLARIERALACRRLANGGDGGEEREEAAEGEPMTLEQIIEALKALATDRENPEDADKAAAMLKAISLDRTEEPEAREEASRAAARVAAKRELDMKMGLWPAYVRNEGTRQYFPLMTPEEARRFLARRAGNTPAGPQRTDADRITGGLPPDESRRLAERMGVRTGGPAVRREGNHQTFPVMTPEEARAFIASRRG